MTNPFKIPPLFFALLFMGCNALWALDISGNFALPPSQQPGPLFSFGQNVDGKNILEFQLQPDLLQDNDGHDLLLIPSLIWGATDNLALVYSFPIALDFLENRFHLHSHGLSDLALGAEYQFFSHNSNSEQTEASLVGQITLPSGSTKRTPPTGLGTESLFIGATASMMSKEWYLFISPGIYYFLPHDYQHLGSSYLFDAGIGKNIYSVPNHSIFSSLLEFELYYSSVDKIASIVDRFTGGQSFSIAPSLYWANKTWSVQGGISIPVLQHWRQAFYRQHWSASVLLQKTFKG